MTATAGWGYWKRPGEGERLPEAPDLGPFWASIHWDPPMGSEEAERQRVERNAKRQRDQEERMDDWQTVRDRADGVLAAVLDIHQPNEWSHCDECDTEFLNSWPCDTFATIKAGLTEAPNQ